MLKRYWIHGLWLVSIPLYLWGGTRPDRYAIDVLREAPAYPLRGVLGLIVITSVEAMILYAIIRPRTYERSWKRTGTALLLCLPWLLVCLVTLMHQPPYVFLHFAWVLAVTLVLAGMFAYAMVRLLVGGK
jgi:hypothetical protein